MSAHPVRGYFRACRGAMLFVALAAGLAAPARGQAWRRFVAPPSGLDAAVRPEAGDYERAWNELLVTLLRARAAGADSVARLQALAEDVAAAESRASGGTIGREALRRAARWNAAARADRVRAAERESLGVAAQRAGRYAESEAALVEALQLYTRIGERRRRAWVLGTIGSGRFTTGDFAGADSLYRLALAARREIGDSSLVARALNTLGSTAMQRSRFGEAMAWFRQARDVRVRLGERGPLATTLGYMSAIAVRTGPLDSARVWLPQALALAAGAGDSARTAELCVALGDLRCDAGDPAGAHALASRALAISGNGASRTTLQARHVLGRALAAEGRFTEAAATLETASAMAEGDPASRAQVLLSLGGVWTRLRDPQRARPVLAEAESLGASLGDPGVRARALNDLCVVGRLEGDADRAGDDGRAALDAAVAMGDSSVVREVLVSLGELYRTQHRLAEAEACFARMAAGVADSTSSDAIVAAIDLAVVRDARGDLDVAAATFASALARARAAGLPELVWPAELGLADVAERAGHADEALSRYRAAAARIDTLRTVQREQQGAIAFFADRSYVYGALVHLLGQRDAAEPGRGHGDEAFLWAERARARALLDLLQAGGRTDAPPEPVGIGAARHALADGAQALLVYSTGDSSSTCWVVTRRGGRRLALPPVRALRRDVEALRAAFAVPGGADEPRTQARSHALWTTLVAPALPELRGVRRLVVVPDGPLALLPFEALETERPGATRHVLLERFDVTYAPSVSAFASVAGRHDPGRGAVLAVGDVAFDSTRGLPALPGTRLELDALREAAPPREFVALTGGGATRAALLGHPLLPHAEVLHLATHGVSDALEPSRSGLWFAADPPLGDFVSVNDVLAARLHARLVVLSACESGLGRLERGEGVLGLPRAFLAAGSDAVVVSLWSVPDRTTAELMRGFYDALLRRGLPCDRALADAKRALRLGGPGADPAAWAPFVLVGAPGPLAR